MLFQYLCVACVSFIPDTQNLSATVNMACLYSYYRSMLWVSREQCQVHTGVSIDASTALFRRAIICTYKVHSVGQDRSLGTATCYRLDGQGIECQCGRDFPHPPSLLYNEHQVSFLEVRQPGCGINHPPPSSTEVTEIVQLYLYSPTAGLHGLV
jgi:hypothetical protein